MSNFYFYFLLYSTLVIGMAFGKNMTKKDVLAIDVESYDTNKCPDYSLGNQNLDTCRFVFFCRGDECSSVTKTETSSIEFNNKEGKTENLITEYCTQDSIKESKCKTQTCSKDADCLTNKCSNGICVENESLKVEVCMDAYDYSFLGAKQKTIMHCGKNNKEVCTKDDECASNECSDGVCVRNYHDNTLGGFSIVLCVFIAVFVVIIIITIVLICCCCKCMRRRRNTDKNIV